MKKRLICLFGQHGSGKKTLLNKIYNKDEELLNSLDLVDKNIFYVEPHTDADKYSSENRAQHARIEMIDKCIYNSLFSDVDVLIMNCDFIDFNDRNTSNLTHIAKIYPDIEKEILLLLPSDEVVGYQRLRNTEWFKSDPSHNYKFPMDWYRFSVKYLKEHLYAYQDMGYNVTEIDTLDGYKFVNQDIKKLEKVDK